MEKIVIKACPSFSRNNSQALVEDIREVCQHHHKAGGVMLPTLGSQALLSSTDSPKVLLERQIKPQWYRM